ncbi:TetR family transcriptional regulator [Virgisporangium aliadipatigenens]|uniref:TetR family transcriptional regulator n=1 Tax=Virgisporangium aliadipatigenens TaxID=741659 RepID=A0A8J4DP57_9ACTN|nr:TetR/AcrR family transcriptional regulator [Virgisporangium aliadipatigenens]GIJ45174.1 TetR family transcriptional regulator [Virgisporangium aliadipatigenens]
MLTGDETTVNDLDAEPAWKLRAVERSTKAAKVRAEQRVQRFLHAAQSIIAKRGSTDFTVQEVVDRSHQSLRSFYQHFDGKHELLLALYEDALRQAAERIRDAAAAHDDPSERLRAAVQRLFALSDPDVAGQGPLVTDLSPRLRVSHPAEARAAHGPLIALFTELMTDAKRSGVLRDGVDPARAAALTLGTVVVVAQAGSISEDEVWDFCSRGFAGR